MSWKAKAVAKKNDNREKRAAMAEAKAKAKEEISAVKAKGKADVAAAKGSIDEWSAFAQRIRERAKAKAGPPSSGVNQVGGSSGSGLVR